MSGLLRTVVWTHEDVGRLEAARVRLTGDSLTARGVQAGSTPVPYTLEYELLTGASFVTVSLDVTARGDGWTRTLALRRAANGAWSAEWAETGSPPSGLAPAEVAGSLPELAGAVDCDLGSSPLTNSMPVLRHGLHHGGDPREFLMAFVSVPELAVSSFAQRYTPLAPGLVGYENVDGSFAADIAFDGEGLVVSYPGIARRLEGFGESRTLG